MDELICDGEDGILIDASSDPQVVREMARIIEKVARNREMLAPLMEGCIRTAAHRSWTSSFADFLSWSDRSVKNSSLSRAAVFREQAVANPVVAAIG